MGKTITETNGKDSFRASPRVNRTPASVTREILKVIDAPNVISFAGGLPDDSLFPLEELTEIFRDSVSRKGSRLFQYTDTQGHPELRAWIAERYYPGSSAEEIILVNGSQQGLDLVARYFLEEGSPILLERPSYLGAIQVFSSYSPEFLGIDYGQEGPDPLAMDALLEDSTEKPKFFYCIPDFQNPSGYSYTSAVRERISIICEKHNVPIIEDTAYRELDFDGNIPISLSSLGPENTISVGTFSKTLSPGLRVGWIRAPKDKIRDLTVQKQAMDLHSPQLNQELTFAFVSSSKFEEHLSLIRKVYERKSSETFSYFREVFGDSVRISRPNGGLFLWLEFSEDTDTDLLFRKSIESGLAFVPGSSFFAENVLRRHLRWNFSNASTETSREGIERLRRAYLNLI